MRGGVKMCSKYYKIDSDTGELLPVNAIELKPGDQIRHKEQIEYCSELYKRRDDKTAFVWVLFTYGKDLLPNISDANLTRLIYAATFCGRDGSIMSKELLRVQMRLNKNRWAEFWNEMIDNNIFHEENGIVYVDDNLFSKGRIKTDMNRTRLFCEYVQHIYESCDSSNEHKQLSYLFKIIPFVNRKTNIVCMNPEEQDKSKIQFMKVGQFCDMVGYNKNNARRLIKELLKIRVNGERAIGFFVQDLKEESWVMIVNPKLYFGGDRTKDIFKEQKQLFQLEAENYKNLEGQENN